MIGIDEVGRGSWAGPLVVGAVRLHSVVPGLADSKQLTKKRREQLYEEICAVADVGLGWIAADEIDDIGLSGALRLAAAIALSELDPSDEPVIIDGNSNFLPAYMNVRTIIKADTTVPAVSAASIVAKVARDRWMAQLQLQYPYYDFLHNVGYGTARHRAAITIYGLTRLHRQSFALPVQTT